MAEYIEKSALVAEIENYKNSVGEDEEHCSLVVGRHKGQKMASEHFLSFLDTLEVKEVQEEPVSEDFEEASNNALNKVLNTHEIVNIRSCMEMFEFGAEWKEEQMMKDAIDVVVRVDAGDYPYIPHIELYDYNQHIPLAKKGDKYKVVLIKEEKQ